MKLTPDIPLFKFNFSIWKIRDEIDPQMKCLKRARWLIRRLDNIFQKYQRSYFQLIWKIFNLWHFSTSHFGVFALTRFIYAWIIWLGLLLKAVACMLLVLTPSFWSISWNIVERKNLLNSIYALIIWRKSSSSSSHRKKVDFEKECLCIEGSGHA